MVVEVENEPFARTAADWQRCDSRTPNLRPDEALHGADARLRFFFGGVQFKLAVNQHAIAQAAVQHSIARWATPQGKSVKGWLFVMLMKLHRRASVIVTTYLHPLWRPGLPCRSKASPPREAQRCESSCVECWAGAGGGGWDEAN